MANSKTEDYALILWNYHLMNQKLEKSDCLFLLESHDLRVADYGAQLFHEQWSSYVIVSGGMAHKGDLLETGWEKSEAEIFGDRLKELGVPSKNIIEESKAVNMGENVQFSEEILKAEHIPHESIIAMQKPYMERRTYATIKIHWPHRKLIVTSPPIKYEDYPNEIISLNEMINLMVGDLQRIILYPKKGFQIPQHIPDNVQEAYEVLVKAGFTSHFIDE